MFANLVKIASEAPAGRKLAAAGAFAVMLLGGCAGSSENVINPVAQEASTDLYRLRAGDVVEVTVFREPDMTTRQRVLGDGTISVGYLGRVKIIGETVDEASRKLEGMLNGKFLMSPQVSISIESYASRKFTVLGQVHSAGSFEIPAEGVLTLPEALALAGGNTEIGNLRKVIVNRRSGEKVERLRVDALAPNAQFFEMKEGDVVIVPETIF